MQLIKLIIFPLALVLMFIIGRETAPKGIVDTEYAKCDGTCYPKGFDMIKWCEGFIQPAIEKIKTQRQISELECYEEGFKAGLEKAKSLY